MSSDRYEVVRRIGQGGMCAVYHVVHRGLGRSFAMKTLSPALAGDPDALARFRREADIVARLRHPNIVDVVDWHLLDDGTPCLVMEYLEGEDLGRRIERVGPMPIAEIVRIGGQVLDALAAAHRAGVVHRDLKPANVFLARDGAGGERVVLLDFGVSKLAGAGTWTGTHELVGTPSYMAPEQAEGRRAAIGPRTDLWAMGAILHEMVTGRPAYAADSVPATLYLICHQRPTSAALLRPDVPPALCILIDQALAPAPEDRPADADRMARRLKAAIVGAPHPAILSTASLLRAVKRRRVRWFGSVVLGFALVATGVVGLRPQRPVAGAEPRAVTEPPLARVAEAPTTAVAETPPPVVVVRELSPAPESRAPSPRPRKPRRRWRSARARRAAPPALAARDRPVELDGTCDPF